MEQKENPLQTDSDLFSDVDAISPFHSFGPSCCSERILMLPISPRLEFPAPSFLLFGTFSFSETQNVPVKTKNEMLS